MKNRYTTIDVMAAVHDLKKLEGMRVANIYDINSKTYLIKLQKPNEKAIILFESGIRIHRTYYDWPKAQFPSSFSMKMRKHVKEKRLQNIRQLGVDRVIDMRFGDEDRAVHIIVELYDKGNILLTDHEYNILNILRPRTDKDTDVKFHVKMRYPVDMVRQNDSLPSRLELEEALKSAKKGDNIRRLIAPFVQFGGPLIDHILLAEGFPLNAQVINHAEISLDTINRLENALISGLDIYKEIREKPCLGFLTYKEDFRSDGQKIETYQDFHPFLFSQCSKGNFKTYPSFSEGVDDFYSKMETQKQELRALYIEREALKKFENVKKDQDSRLLALTECQERQKQMGERIIFNKDLVEQALVVIRGAVANQLSWDAIEEMREKAASAGDIVAKSIVKLNLDSNMFTMRLPDPFCEDNPSMDIAIDIGLSAFQNSRRYFVDKKAAAEKEQKTLASANKAIKNAQIKTKETLKQVHIHTEVVKTRKPMWFEKFLWFISTEKYIVVGGRDAHQNELLVKRYLRAGDIYVHADVRGAASIIIRNKQGKGEIPPKTLTEAAQMAVCYSNAWEANVISSAWWVRHNQVSRTAPSGEYLTAGSFMIRGKKNYMPPSPLVLGLGLMFRLDDESSERYKSKIKVGEQDDQFHQNNENSVHDKYCDIEEGEKGDKIKEKEGEDEGVFPDIQVEIKGLKLSTDADEEYSIIEIGPKAKSREQVKQVTKEKETQKYLEHKEEERRISAQNKGQTKRQKHKLEKVKKKYGDQDEEEREMRMQLLGSRGKCTTEPKLAPVIEKNDKGKENTVFPDKKNEENLELKKEREGADEEDDDIHVEDSEGFLYQLTANPMEDDGLLHAVPVVAPYQALNSFKYKVKLTSGTGKRSKAAKSALELFLRSKNPNQREGSLIKALIGDDQASRNIPGKVRVSAPQLHSK